MARRKSRSKRTKEPTRRALDDEEMARALSLAATIGTAAAAKEFQLNRRTIQRYQRMVDDGQAPHLARMIAEERSRLAERTRDKLSRAFDALLNRAIELAPTATMGEVTTCLEKVGDLVLTRKVLGGSSLGPGAAEAPPDAAGPGGPAPGRPALQAVS